jgi:hypothetical protein
VRCERQFAISVAGSGKRDARQIPQPLDCSEPFVPDKPTRWSFDAGHLLSTGHGSSAEHLVSVGRRNLQKLVDIYSAKDKDFQTATQRVYRDGPGY